MVPSSSPSNVGCMDFTNADYWHKNFSRKGKASLDTTKVNTHRVFSFTKPVQLHSLYMRTILESNILKKKIRSTHCIASINIIRSPLTTKGRDIWVSIWDGTTKIEESILICMGTLPRHANDFSMYPLPNYKINPICMSHPIMEQKYSMSRPLIIFPHFRRGIKHFS